MSQHPPLMEQLAVMPVLVSFTLDALVVKCPKCGAPRTYKLASERPSGAPCCTGCGQPWRFA